MNAIKNLIIFGIGAATGALIAIKMLEDHYSCIADEEIEAVKEMARKKIKEVEEKYEKDNQEVKEVINETENIIKNKYAKLATNYSNPAQVKDDAENEYPREDEYYDDEEDEIAEKEAESERLAQRFDVEPYLITDEEFCNENTHYEKETLWYYELDMTLADDQEEIIDNVDQLIGEGTLDLIEDERTIYIRNDRQARDFEIICLTKSYQEEVMGVITVANAEEEENE